MTHRRLVGRTPWSARVPLDPLFARPNQLQIRERPTGGAAVDQGVRPTIATALWGSQSWLQPAFSRLHSTPSFPPLEAPL